jgi:hypothetical protein
MVSAIAGDCNTPGEGRFYGETHWIPLKTWALRFNVVLAAYPPQGRSLEGLIL